MSEGKYNRRCLECKRQEDQHGAKFLWKDYKMGRPKKNEKKLEEAELRRNREDPKATIFAGENTEGDILWQSQSGIKWGFF